MDLMASFFLWFTVNSAYTVGTESIQTPLNFSLFVILQPFKFIFFASLMYTQAAHIDRKTQNCWHFLQIIKKEKLKYHHGPKYSDP